MELLFGNPYPPPPDLWNHRLAGKTPKNLWAAISYGQNLERQGFSWVEELPEVEVSMEERQNHGQGQVNIREN
jgi:hypothetical protein